MKWIDLDIEKPIEEGTFFLKVDGEKKIGKWDFSVAKITRKFLQIERPFVFTGRVFWLKEE